MMEHKKCCGTTCDKQRVAAEFEKLKRERDEALAYAERLRGAWDAVKNTDWDQPMNEVIDELPSAALTKLKAECQSDALIQIADEFKKAWPDDQRKYFWMVDYAYENRQRVQGAGDE